MTNSAKYLDKMFTKTGDFNIAVEYGKLISLEEKITELKINKSIIINRIERFEKEYQELKTKLQIINDEEF